MTVKIALLMKNDSGLVKTNIMIKRKTKSLVGRAKNVKIVCSCSFDQDLTKKTLKMFSLIIKAGRKQTSGRFHYLVDEIRYSFNSVL